MNQIGADEKIELIKLEFDKEINKLKIEGTNHSKGLAKKLEDDKNYLIEKVENLKLMFHDHVSENKSDIMSIKHSNKILWETTIPKINNKIDTSIKYSQDASLNTSEARRLVDEGKKTLNDFKKWSFAIFMAILICLLGTFGTGFYKIFQDKGNQEQTINIMNDLKKELSKLNMNVKK
jgi:hypothetical protein